MYTNFLPLIILGTPLWRNGPPEKPILCNACGSRWRTKGTLSNYTPLHARAEPDDFEDYRFSRLKATPTKNKEAKILKRKPTYESFEVGGFSPDYNQGFRKGFDEDTSNRSSSGSAISNSESCAQFGDASDLTGPAQPAVWDSMVPSRKRTCVTRAKPSSVEKLTKDLYTILHEQQSSYFSGSSEEDLLFESDKPMVSVEIGHGSVLIRHPSTIAREEESEASSLSVDNKLHTGNEAYSRLTTFPVHTDNKGVNSTPEMEKIKKPTCQGVDHEQQIKRDQLEKLQLLGHHNSPLHSIDLKEILNFAEFSQLTNDERQQLLKFLPPIDASVTPESLRSMFESPQFEENMSNFQKLLAEGVLDNTLSGVKTDDCRTLKRLVLCNLTKSKWVEHYSVLKDKRRTSSCKSDVAGEFNVATGHSVNMKRSRDAQTTRFPGAKTMVKSPKRVTTKADYEQRDFMNNNGSYFSPRNLFGPPPDNNSLVIDSFTSAESCDQDLLLDVPSNSSFPQAELLHPSSSFGAQASTSSSSGYPYMSRP
ncbi:OLC1v1031620C2 [Oldenlandia corymbosa var. corymbosa]|uniref:OLC1v1031620C2 n=1 Tax=Oldenlandia corymbosa var. corymbosa TaxID=529605 RepID=A0AAV1CJR4_OLDCO|nr:OLC1v1031620C2 [Oldenlandia corymbosa var. corymbosa]